MYEKEAEKGRTKETEYIDRHHFHYDYNIVQNTMATTAGGNTGKGRNREYFDKEEENTTMMTNEYHNNSSNNTTNIYYNTNNNHEMGNKSPTSHITMAMNKNVSSNNQ